MAQGLRRENGLERVAGLCGLPFREPQFPYLSAGPNDAFHEISFREA